MRIYRQHLQEQAEEEIRREKELDAIVTAEVEKQWLRRAEQWRMEAEARQSLLQDVLEIRKQQVQDKREKSPSNVAYLMIRITTLSGFVGTRKG